MSDYESSTGPAHALSDAGGLLVMLVLLYFVPSIIAFRRVHHKRGAIKRLNVLFGWSVLGWIVALILALTPVQKAHRSNERMPVSDCANPRGSEDGFSPV
ncbi:superinfection immunity protein [Paraburkholderia mimosarum]|uniref:superinfection immunity protein n=1 Tax=Paraburkholderia mimosarum TaxID=312026 RepID=UPI0009DF6EC6|nr:superinfection immunity protein [Paraburkholderia mimosarum]